MGNQQQLTLVPPAPARAPASGARTAVYWRLGGELTACIAADQVLLLDLRSNRYFGLPDSCNRDFAAWLHAGGRAKLPEGCAAMLSRLAGPDLARLRERRPEPCLVTRPQAVDSDLLRPSGVRPGRLLAAGIAVASAWRDVRSLPLSAILAKRLAPCAQGRAPAETLRRRLAEFRTLRPLVPVPRVCLHDCLALLDWLGPARAGAELVLGVTAFPFSAHCWVQFDGRVIDDHPDSPSRFQPILRRP